MMLLKDAHNGVVTECTEGFQRDGKKGFNPSQDRNQENQWLLRVVLSP